MALRKIEWGAETLAVPRQAVYRLIRERVIPARAVVRVGRCLRLHEERFREWIDEGGSGAAGGGCSQ